ncbi:hypothetical protein Tco_0488597, partial [Tanacetum coccineum]
TTGNVYRDNIQEYVSQAAATNYNQGNTGYRAPIANQIRPPGFPLVQNNHNVQNQGNNQNRYNQNRGNFNQASAYQPPVHQGQIYRPQVVQPPAYQAPAYQAPAPQIQGVSKEDFQAYVKANDAVMRNMQTQGQNMQNQLTNLTDMLSKFVTSNTASTSGTLPSNTVTNPKEDLKGITTRSGVAYKGPTIPTTSSFTTFFSLRVSLKDLAVNVMSLFSEGLSELPFVLARGQYSQKFLVRKYVHLDDFSFSKKRQADSFLAIEEAILNSEPSPPLQGNYFPETRKDLKICEANNEKSSVNEPPEVELKDLPPHLEYAFLEGDDKLPVIIAKDLKNEEKEV